MLAVSAALSMITPAQQKFRCFLATTHARASTKRQSQSLIVARDDTLRRIGGIMRSLVAIWTDVVITKQGLWSSVRNLKRAGDYLFFESRTA